MTELIEKPKCGVVMPISAIDGCSEGHWGEVLAIVCDAVDSAGFTGSLVSGADDVGIIQERIIKNLYSNPIVVCDVSGKNPNVMFELGMRLAFDKPTIIIKDDKTSYSFDTSPIEHLEYPRDLRFLKIVEFKKKLSEKIKATFERSQSDQNYTTFLKHFGEFKVAKIDQKEIPGFDFLVNELEQIKGAFRRLENRTFPRNSGDILEPKDNSRKTMIMGLDNRLNDEQVDALINSLHSNSEVNNCSVHKTSNNEQLLRVDYSSDDAKKKLISIVHGHIKAAQDK